MTRTASEVRASLARRHYGPSIIGNMRRGDVAEDIVAAILEPSGWRLCPSDDGGGWDLEHADGTCMEVKNSAALQAWAGKPKRPHVPSFDIAPRAGRYESGVGYQKADAPIRYSQIYVFAYHGVTDAATADQCDPTQWTFYVLSTRELPDQKHISLNPIRKLAAKRGLGPYTVNSLAAGVELVRSMLRPHPLEEPK
jgi:hypothetical protein